MATEWLLDMVLGAPRGEGRASEQEAGPQAGGTAPRRPEPYYRVTNTAPWMGNPTGMCQGKGLSDNQGPRQPIKRAAEFQ